MTTTLGLLAAAALVLANGYFVAVEFAFVAVRRPALEAAAAAGDRTAARTLGVTRRLSFVLSGAQLGITVTSLVLGSIAEPTLARALRPVVGWLGLPDGATRAVAFAAAFVAATGAQMVLGELAPKNLAIARPEPVARRLARSVGLYTAVAGPVIRLFDGAANRLLRLAGIEPVEELEAGVTRGELDVIVEASARSGALTVAQADLLARVLGFPDRTAGEVMVPRPRVSSLPVTATGADLRRRLTTPHTRYPVTAEPGDLDTVVGIAHAEDLLAWPPEVRDTVPIADVMRPPLVVPDSAPVTAVLEQLRVTGCEMAVVVDEYGGTAGILTLEDLVEELVGPIVDEHDPDEAVPRPLGARAWWVPGHWRIDEVAHDTGISLPEGEDYDTVAGLVLHLLGRLPEVGDRAEVGGTALIVAAVRGHRIDGVILVPGAAP